MCSPHIIPASQTPRFRNRPGLCAFVFCAAILAGLNGTGCAPTNPDDGLGSEDRGLDMIEANLDRLPARRPDRWTHCRKRGPAGSLAGILLDDGSRAFVLGSIADDLVSITGVVLQDSNGSFILQQNIYGNGTEIIFDTATRSKSSKTTTAPCSSS